jgi:hypothetical protein
MVIGGCSEAGGGQIVAGPATGRLDPDWGGEPSRGARPRACRYLARMLPIASSPTYGLSRRSSPNVDIGPWPGTKRMSSP